MTPLSVVVITFNESENIARCLESVRPIADEIIVLDSGSEDDTLAIAKKYGATVKVHPFEGYVEQKNHALDCSTHPFVLSLDADEALDGKLVQEIQKVKENTIHRAYRINRCTNYCGTFIRHGSWYPDAKVWLFDKRIARWGGMNPHAEVRVDEGVSIGALNGDILHYSYQTLEEHVQQNNHYSTVAAQQYFKRGKRSGTFKLLFSPAWAFFHSFVIRAGFLDGFLGFVIARNIAHMTFMKYYKLRALHLGIKIR